MLCLCGFLKKRNGKLFRSDEFMSQIQQLQFVAFHKRKQAHRKKVP